MGILILIAAFEISYIRVCAQRKNCKKKYIEKCCYRFVSSTTDVQKYMFYSLFYSVKNLDALLVPIVMPAGGTPLPLEDFDVKVAIRRHFFSHLSNSHDKTNDHTERRKNLKRRLVQGPPSNKFEEEAS